MDRTRNPANGLCCSVGLNPTLSARLGRRRLNCPMIEIRKTRPTEVQVLMDIFEQAKRIMRKNGNMLQWSGNYPSPEMITADIKKGNSYVCSDNGGEIVGTFAFIRGNDPTYTHIYEGEWLENTLPYGVIHRLASTENSRGVADACLQWCYKQIPNLRVDTHRHNRILQHILKKHGFQYCGIIFLANGDERLAFQKTADAVPSPSIQKPIQINSHDTNKN